MNIEPEMRIRHILLFILFLTGIIIISGYVHSSENENRFNAERLLKNIEKPRNELLVKYEDFLKEFIDSTDNVGAAVTVVSYDSVVYLNSFGLTNANEEDSVNVNTVFRLASVSKGFAGVLAAILEQDSIIDLDEKVVDILPGFKLKDSASTSKLTIRHTLNHTTGLVPHAFDNLVEAGVSVSQIITQLRNVDIAAEPGKVYGYQNAVFSLLDTILRVKTQKSYAEHLEERIFAPLEMKNASANFSKMQENNNIAYPHIRSSKGYVPVKLNNRYYSASPAAGVNASIQDMSEWLKALLGSRPEVIDSSVISLVSSPTVYTPLRRSYTLNWGDVEDRHYGLGWRIYRFRGHDIVYHGGYVKGYRAEIAFCREENTGIVFLQNSPNRLSSMSVPKFWNLYFDLKESMGKNTY